MLPLSPPDISAGPAGPRRVGPSALLASTILLGPGCATTAILQSPTPLGAGQLELAAEPGVFGVGVPGDGSMIPHLGLSARYGLSDRLDVGARLHGGGLQATGRFALTEPGAPIAAALTPALGLGALPDDDLVSLTAQLPVLVGLPVGAHQLILGAQAHAWAFKDSPTGFGYALSPGGSVGFAARVSDRLTLLPEASMVWGLASDMGGGGWEIGWSNGPLFQGALALQLQP